MVVRRWLALFAVLLAVLAVGMDITILSVALPTLATALHASETALQWFSSAYTLALVAAMLPVGFLGDRYGRKLLMVLSLILFALGSAACAFAPSTAVFTAARVALGVAGAALIIMALSSMLVLFDDQERPKAVAAWAAFNFIAMPIGPILGGWLLAHFWWGWVFLINVPVALIALVAVLVLVPESRATEPPALDLPGVGTSSGGLLALTYGLITAGQSGWGSAAALAEMGGGALLLLSFALWERRLWRGAPGRPLIDRELVTSRSFGWGVSLLFLLTLAMIGVLFTMPQYFQAILGVNAEGSGLRLLALVVGLILGAAGSSRLGRLGMRTPVALGFVVLCLGLALGSRMAVGSGYLFIGTWMALTGIGMGAALTAIVSGALGQISGDQGGVGSGLMQTLKNLGAPFGTAILGSALAAAYSASLHLPHLPAAARAAARQSVFAALALAGHLGSPALAHAAEAAFVHGMDVSLVVAAAVALCGAILAVLVLPGASREPAAAGDAA